MTDDIHLRSATAADIPAMLALINGFAAHNLMLPRSERQMQRIFADFLVAVEGDRVVGCGSLIRLAPELAEIRSLAVAENQQGKGIGLRLVHALIDRARQLQIPTVFALTLQPGFFERLGFTVVDRWQITPKVWQECIYCPKFHACDEIAMILPLDGSNAATLPLSPAIGAWMRASKTRQQIELMHSEG